MPIKTQLETALKDSMRSGDEIQKRVLRMALSAIRLTEIDKGVELDDPAVLAILQKEMKSYQETCDESQNAGRTDLAEKAKAEMGVLKNFLPMPYSPEELESVVRQVIAELGATSIKDMGQVMKALVPRLQGRATGDQASQAVRKLLM